MNKKREKIALPNLGASSLGEIQEYNNGLVT